MGHTFSSMKRQDYIGAMEKEELDLLVIGGGITGAGIVLDAQVRGLKAGLIEMQDFAAGTSSRSTKLIHGGLRYLKQLELQLVAEVGKEREIVYENAPHVISPEKMLLPIFKEGTFGKFSTSVGLALYDRLAKVQKSERRHMLSRRKVQKVEPLLRTEKLKGAGMYVEYRTDDARLTIEVLKEAVNRGTIALNYMKAESFIYQNEKAIGAFVVDQITGQAYKFFAKKIVNATGPWVDTIREQDRSKKGKAIRLSKGVHIVVSKIRFPLRQAVYFDTMQDGRMLFAIPRDEIVYIGTTDTFYKGELTSPKMTETDLNYIISATNYMFPTVHLCRDDVLSSWVGLRSLIDDDGVKEASKMSRKEGIFVSDSGLLSIAGGKLTGYRKMAERIVDIITKDLGIDKVCETEQIALSGGYVDGSKGFDLFIQLKIEEGKALGLSEKKAKELTNLYGSNVSKVFTRINTHQQKASLFGLPISLYAQLRYGIEEEMVQTPLDFFIRRTGALFFHTDWMEKWHDAVIQCMREIFEWTDEVTTKYKIELTEEIHFAKTPI